MMSMKVMMMVMMMVARERVNMILSVHILLMFLVKMATLLFSKRRVVSFGSEKI